jgi:propanol-preferring alcohol dehydrogenase
MIAYQMVDWQKPPKKLEINVPKPSHGQILVKVAGNGLCHSDLFIMREMTEQMGQMAGWKMPFTLGHEIGGWIEDLGEGVEGLSIGDPIVLVSPHSDGTCPHCLSGHDNCCEQGIAGRGYGRDGGLAQLVLVNTVREVIKLNTLDPVTSGPLTDAGATSYHAVKRVVPKLIPGATAVVIGVGGLGSFAVQFLRTLSPARIIAVDKNPARLEFSSELGAHEALAGINASTAQDLLGLTDGRGAEAVLDFFGSDETIEAGLGAVRKAGAFCLIGAEGGMFKQPWFNFLPKEAEIFTFQGPTIADTREVIALAEAGLVRNEVEVFPFSRVEEAYEKLDRGAIQGRAIVTPNN